MGNFSKPPNDVLQNNLNKNYVGVYIEQGVPVLDRDLNLMQDIISRTLRSLISRFIGDGVASGSNGFAIQAIPANNDFRILTGSVLVNGIDVINGADINYSSQAGVPLLTTPPASPPPTRTDTVYLDVSLALVEVSGAQDQDLLNSSDVGLQTSVRQKVVWVARVAEGATSPPSPAAGHTHFPLARLVRIAGATQIQASMITDLRKQISPLGQVDELLRIITVPTFNASPNQFNPKLGPPGTTINLLGNAFNVGFSGGAVSVRFGATAATILGTPTAGQINVTVPTMPTGQVKITVQTAGGSVTSIDSFSVT